MKTVTYGIGGYDITKPNNNVVSEVDDGVAVPLMDGAVITSSATLPPGKYTFMVDASAGQVELTPDVQGGDYKIVKIDSSSNPVVFKATVNGVADMTLVNQYANMNLFGTGTTYFLAGNN